jgi:hypothetical protein
MFKWSGVETYIAELFKNRQKWRKEFLSNKWLNMTEMVACKEYWNVLINFWL